MSDPARTELQFRVTEHSVKVSAVLLCPPRMRWLLVFAHGAGAGMHHPFMNCVSEDLAVRSIGTFRYQFPYMEQGSGRPDPPSLLVATVRSAVHAAREAVPDLPLIAGGKSLGGRMTSTAASQTPVLGVEGLVFFGFPLHRIGERSIERAWHLRRVTVPMLFLQGTRDKLADLELLRPVCREIGNLAKLHVVDGADHSFNVLKRSGRNHHDVLHELGKTVAEWAAELGNNRH